MVLHHGAAAERRDSGLLLIKVLREAELLVRVVELRVADCSVAIMLEMSSMGVKVLIQVELLLKTT